MLYEVLCGNDKRGTHHQTLYSETWETQIHAVVNSVTRDARSDVPSCGMDTSPSCNSCSLISLRQLSCLQRRDDWSFLVQLVTSLYGNCHSVYGNCQENGVDPNEFVQAWRFSCVTLDGSAECGGASWNLSSGIFVVCFLWSPIVWFHS